MTELYLDIDGDLPADTCERIRFVLVTLGYKCECIRMDRTRRGWHIIVTLRRRLAPRTVVALQAIMGSDWKRETFNLLLVLQWRHVPPFWRERWNVLYVRHDRGVMTDGKRSGR